jgi:hypothetical protein
MYVHANRKDLFNYKLSPMYLELWSDDNQTKAGVLVLTDLTQHACIHSSSFEKYTFRLGRQTFPGRFPHLSQNVRSIYVYYK